MVECPYKEDCTSYPHKCGNCRYNKSKKKDYYQPDMYYEPIWRYDPPYGTPVLWCTGGYKQSDEE